MALRANALTTVALFNSDTGNSTTAVAERFIDAASDAIEQYLGRSLQYATGLAETVPAFGTTRLMVSRTPLRAVTSVVTVDSATIDSTSYSIEGDGEAGFIYRADGWRWTADAVTAMEPYRLPGTEKPYYVVTYAGGYSLPNDATQTYPLPASIQEACLALAGHYYRNRNRRLDIASETVGNASQTFAGLVQGMPAYVAAMLDPFKRVGT